MKPQTMVSVSGECTAIRNVTPPKNDKTATPIVFGYPYMRLRCDNKGMFIMRYGVRVPATLVFK
jgi:hypothetical protein